MIGNDQPGYQTMERIKEASMAAGYKFKINSIRTWADSSVFEIMNYGVAPFYYDAYVAVDGVRSSTSLKLLGPGETIDCGVSAGAKDAEISIESDKLVEGQEIQFMGTQDATGVAESGVGNGNISRPYPNPVKKGASLFLEGNLEGTQGGDRVSYYVYDSLGKLSLQGESDPGTIEIPTGDLDHGMYVLKVEQNKEWSVNRFMIL
jgi:hypothetical protein